MPDFVRIQSDDPAHVLPGYDFDVTDEDALLQTIRIEGGRLRGPWGMEWRALALPSTRRISLAALDRAEQYVGQGGTLIGLAPQSTTGQAGADTQVVFKALVARLWDAQCANESYHDYGKGQVFCTENARAALTAMKVAPDLSLAGEPQSVLSASSQSPLDYIHQRVGDTDLYFSGTVRTSSHGIGLSSAWKGAAGGVRSGCE